MACYPFITQAPQLHAPGGLEPFNALRPAESLQGSPCKPPPPLSTPNSPSKDKAELSNQDAELSNYEAVLLKEMETYLREHCGGGSTSFVKLQRYMKDTFSFIVDKIIPSHQHSWHRFLAVSAPRFTLFHYQACDVERLGLGDWADEHEARICLVEISHEECEFHDVQNARVHAAKVSELMEICGEAVREKGTVEVAYLAKLLVEKLPFFDGITKSALKRILSRTPSSTVWVSGNYVKCRRFRHF
jgi:hypothetical protein